jgi:hypothetical protein
MNDPRHRGLVSLATVIPGWDYWIVSDVATTVARGVEIEQARLRGSGVLVLLDWTELHYDGIGHALAIHSGHADVTVAESIARQAAGDRFDSLLDRLDWKSAAVERVPSASTWPDSPDSRMRTFLERSVWDGVGWCALDIRVRLWTCDPERPVDGDLITLLCANHRDSAVVRHFIRVAEAAFR